MNTLEEIKSLSKKQLGRALAEREKTAREATERIRRVKGYVTCLRGFPKGALDNMMISLDYDSRFFGYTPDELSNFEKRYGVPIKSNKDLECLAFAVSEKLQALNMNEEQRKESEKGMKISPDVRKKLIRLALAACIGVASFGPCILPNDSREIPKNINYPVEIYPIEIKEYSHFYKDTDHIQHTPLHVDFEKDNKLPKVSDEEMKRIMEEILDTYQ
jgi:hypothetical protein